MVNFSSIAYLAFCSGFKVSLFIKDFLIYEMKQHEFWYSSKVHRYLKGVDYRLIFPRKWLPMMACFDLSFQVVSLFLTHLQNYDLLLLDIP